MREKDICQKVDLIEGKKVCKNGVKLEKYRKNNFFIEKRSKIK